ncbi:MAG: cell division protein FtsA [Bacteroidales bacterium]|nr:cell division protein FtsA [Bacteroidales bacterium]
METSDIFVGLDLGTTKIAAIVGRKNENGKIEILGYGKAESIGIHRGVVANIDKTVESIKEAVSKASEQSGVEIAEVNVGIAGNHIKSLQHRGNIMLNSLEDVIKVKDVENLVESMYKIAMQPGDEIIHVIPQEYIIDKEGGIKDPVGMCGSCLEGNFHIVTGQVSAIKNIQKCVLMAGLETKDLILEPLASAEAVLSEEEKEAGVALVDIGGGTTDIAIFHDQILRHTAVIPFGGNIITEDIKEGCSIIKSYAEHLKVNFGSALESKNSHDYIVSIPGVRGRDPKEISLKNLASIIQARMEEILAQVDFEIKSSGFANKLICGIVLTGGGAQLKDIKQLTEFVTGHSTRIGYPNEHLGNNQSEEITNPMHATGVGLVLKGIQNYELKRKFEKNTDEKVVKKKKKGLFEDILNKGKKLFEDEIE